MKKALILLCAGTFLYSTSQAHHILGGTMHYSFVGTSGGISTYDITLEILRDNESGGAQFDQHAEFGIWSKDGSGEYTFLQSAFAPHGPVQTLEFADHALYPHGRVVEAQYTQYQFRVYLKEENISYVIGYRRCCRIDDLTNVFDNTSVSPFEPGAAYAIEITSEALALHNSSPKPVTLALDFLLPAGDFERLLAFVDHDGDSLSYAWTAPLIGGASGIDGTSERACDGIRPNPSNCPPPFDIIDYLPGYLMLSPFGDTTTVQLDPQNGLMFGTISHPGLYLIGLVVKEYRNSTLLSETVLDFTFRVPLDRKISGAFGYRFYDGNGNNKRDGNEPTISELLVEFNPDAAEAVFYSDGSYHMWADTGIYEFRSLDPIFQISATPPFRVHLDSVASQFQIDIPFVATNSFTDLDMYIWNPSFRCDRDVMLKLMVCNQGATVQSGDVLITLDSSMTFLSGDPGMIMINAFQFLWHYDSLHPFNKEALQFTVQMPSADLIGEILEIQAEAFYYPLSDPSLIDTFVYEIKGELRCGYDPNDKTTHPVRGNNNGTLADEYITYTIRFQNTGNDTAYNVRIVDALPNNVDIESLRILGASHPCTVEMIGRSLNVIFRDIHLPDSATNTEGSKGYFYFKVKPLASVYPGVWILNSAKIYFDGNNPIATNFVQNLIVSSVYSEGTRPKPLFGFNVYPNPSPAHFTLSYPYYPAPSFRMTLYDLTGKIVDILEVNQLFTEFGQGLSPGVYFYRIEQLDGTPHQRGTVIKH